MKVDGVHYRTIWVDPVDEGKVRIIDQTELPHRFVIRDLRSFEEVAEAIRSMKVRGAGLIGAAAAYGMYLARRNAPTSGTEEHLRNAAELLISTRPTAQNLSWAVGRCLSAIETAQAREESHAAARVEARRIADVIADEDAEYCRMIGFHGLKIIRELHERRPDKPVEILTHCNAGWLAFVDYGSATSPVYLAHDQGIPVHVWVDETRPRNQGAFLTSWELGRHGVPHHVIVDNAGGHIMQHGMVDMVITGADRVTRSGDVANKIGTYLKALAARDNNLPFYVALPSSTFDWSLTDGVNEIPIEERDPIEVLAVRGKEIGNGEIKTVRICADGTRARNFGFDVTPARLISGLITERGVCEPAESAIRDMFPEHTLPYTVRDGGFSL
jgi:methylthioribose-1-phosphate isomerase